MIAPVPLGPRRTASRRRSRPTAARRSVGGPAQGAPRPRPTDGAPGLLGDLPLPATPHRAWTEPALDARAARRRYLLPGTPLDARAPERFGRRCRRRPGSRADPAGRALERLLDDGAGGALAVVGLGGRGARRVGAALGAAGAGVLVGWHGAAIPMVAFAAVVRCRQRLPPTRRTGRQNFELAPCVQPACFRLLLPSLVLLAAPRRFAQDPLKSGRLRAAPGRPERRARGRRRRQRRAHRGAAAPGHAGLPGRHRRRHAALARRRASRSRWRRPPSRCRVRPAAGPRRRPPTGGHRAPGGHHVLRCRRLLGQQRHAPEPRRPGAAGPRRRVHDGRCHGALPLSAGRLTATARAAYGGCLGARGAKCAGFQPIQSRSAWATKSSPKPTAAARRPSRSPPPTRPRVPASARSQPGARHRHPQQEEPRQAAAQGRLKTAGANMQLDIYRRPEPEHKLSFMAVPGGQADPAGSRQRRLEAGGHGHRTRPDSPHLGEYAIDDAAGADPRKGLRHHQRRPPGAGRLLTGR
jgi:hypothetical protein